MRSENTCVLRMQRMFYRFLHNSNHFRFDHFRNDTAAARSTAAAARVTRRRYCNRRGAGHVFVVSHKSRGGCVLGNLLFILILKIINTFFIVFDSFTSVIPFVNIVVIVKGFVVALFVVIRRRFRR